MMLTHWSSYFATRYKNLRIAMSLVFILPFFAGIIGLRVLDDSNPWGRLVSLWLCFFFASPYGIGMALVNANTAGHTKRITTNAMFIIGAGIGSFIGPFFFDSRQAPYYTLGFNFMFATFSIEVVVLAALFYVLWRRNKAKKSARGGADADAWAGKQSGFLDETDIENKDFVVSRIILLRPSMILICSIVCVLRKVKFTRLRAGRAQSVPTTRLGETSSSRAQLLQRAEVRYLLVPGLESSCKWTYLTGLLLLLNHVCD
jgi:hypothetical protein